MDRILERVVSSYSAHKGGSEFIPQYVEKVNKQLEFLAKEIRDLKTGGAVVWEGGENSGEVCTDESKEGKKVPEYLSEAPPEKMLFAPIPPKETEKVRLKRIPGDVLSTMIAMKWLELLIDKVGISNLPDVLEFYNEMGWISEEALITLVKYARGTKPFHEDVDWKPDEKLTARDHMLSLLFIEKLRGKKVSRDLLILLDREVKKIKSSAEEIYGV